MKRILLKLSGEALAGEKKTGFDEDTVRGVAVPGTRDAHRVETGVLDCLHVSCVREGVPP